MPELKTTRQLSTKAFEICYAAFRVGASIENRVFVEHLEAWALSLLEAVNSLSKERGIAALVNLEYLVSLARDVNLLNPANSHLFLREIEGMKSAIAEYFTTEPTDFDLSKIFHSESMDVNSEDQKEDLFEKSEISDLHPQNSSTYINAAMRQSAIIEKMRQNNVCRLRDIQEILPDTSERTLRYDIQNLMEKGIVVRIGNGGPATAYRLAEEKVQELPSPSFSGQ